MHRKEDDDSSSLRPLNICRRLYRFVVGKLGILGEKEMNEDERERNKKLTKKGSRSDITIHFKEVEDSEDNRKHKNNSHASSSQESERETVINLANGSNGPKKRLHDKGKKREASPKQHIPEREAGKAAEAHKGPRPFLSDINRESDAFIESRLEKMRNSLA